MVSLRRRLPALRRHQPAPEPAASSTPPDAEALLPRWLRPSVKAARVASLKSPAPSKEGRAPVLFAAPVDGAKDRLVVRYDRVQLLDRPDDALGMPRGELDTGDEVEVLERNPIWTRVRTPAHPDGWVPAMTLASADVLATEPDPEPAAEDIHGRPREADLPPLEELLAIAAERRALIDAPLPAAPVKPRKPPTQAKQRRPDQARKTKKSNRRTSTRKKRH
jgi:hypothetical protein